MTPRASARRTTAAGRSAGKRPPASDYTWRRCNGRSPCCGRRSTRAGPGPGPRGDRAEFRRCREGQLPVATPTLGAGGGHRGAWTWCSFGTCLASVELLAAGRPGRRGTGMAVLYTYCRRAQHDGVFLRGADALLERPDRLPAVNLRNPIMLRKQCARRGALGTDPAHPA